MAKTIFPDAFDVHSEEMAGFTKILHLETLAQRAFKNVKQSSAI